MPEIQGPKKGSGEKKSRQFISEKIVKQPLTKRQVATRGVFVVCTALIWCGVCVQFYGSEAVCWTAFRRGRAD